AKQITAKEKKNQSVPKEPLVPSQETPDNLKKRQMILIIAAIVGLVFCLTIYYLRLDNVFGLVVDDAWYVLLAKALATGQGYTLINSPTSGIRPFYSPAFPALLSIFYRLWPSFPDNILLLKSVSIAAMMGVGILAFIYYRRSRELPVWVSYGLALAVVLYPAIVFLATSTIMSECVFMLILLGAIVLVERSVRDDKPASAWRWSALAGALAGAAFLTRPAGIGLLAASVIYFFHKKLIKHAVIFATVVAVFLGPWIIYSRLHAPTEQQRLEQGANIVQTYGAQFWQKLAGQPLSGTID